MPDKFFLSSSGTFVSGADLMSSVQGERVLWSGHCAVAEYAFDEPASLPRWTLAEETEVVVTEERVVYANFASQAVGELRWHWPQHLRVQPGNRETGRSATVTQIQLVCAGPGASFPALVFAGGDLTAVGDADRLANVLRQAIARFRVEHAAELGLTMPQSRMLSRLVIAPEFSNYQGGEGQTVSLLGSVAMQPRPATDGPTREVVAYVAPEPIDEPFLDEYVASDTGWVSTAPVSGYDADSPISTGSGYAPIQAGTEYVSAGARSLPAYAAPEPPYGTPEPAYGTPEPAYGAAERPYAALEPAYGGAEQPYAALEPTYGAPEPSYAGPEPSYAEPPYAATEPSYAAAEPSYPAAEPSYAAAEPSYAAAEPSYPAAEPAYSAAEADDWLSSVRPGRDADATRAQLAQRAAQTDQPDLASRAADLAARVASLVSGGARLDEPLARYETETTNLSAFLSTPGGAPAGYADAAIAEQERADRAEMMRRTAARFAGNSARARNAGRRTDDEIGAASRGGTYRNG
jgi:hypothetical protein